MFLKILLVMLGGGLGAVMRFGIGHTVMHNSESNFPWGTLAVNLIGCAGIGIFGAFLVGPWPIREEVRLFAMIGILGGFTTFSSFGYETFELLEDHAYMKAAAYVITSNVAGIALVFGAFTATRAMIGESPA